MDPFAVLGVDAEASHEELRRAHRRLARRHHPDLAGDPDERAVADRRMAEINAAYRLATDDAERERADAMARRRPDASRTDDYRAAAASEFDVDDDSPGPDDSPARSVDDGADEADDADSAGERTDRSDGRGGVTGDAESASTGSFTARRRRGLFRR